MEEIIAEGVIFIDDEDGQIWVGHPDKDGKPIDSFIEDIEIREGQILRISVRKGSNDEVFEM